MSKRKAPPAPPRLPEADALAAYCHECFVNPGEPCTNYKGQAKPPCRNRGHAQAQPAAPAAPPRDLFATLEAEAQEVDATTPETPEEAEEPAEAETPDDIDRRLARSIMAQAHEHPLY